MSLAAGVRLGPYEIDSAIGAGGMGEVWKARDTTLGRDVALKILPDHFALDSDRLARFKREAQILASLNHPNIATIHGFQEADGVQALVMELVEGRTLADWIAEGPIPIDDALPIAKQIAEALEAAHERGIIHRDLKPANIKVRPDGTVKVLDFGLAKAIEQAAGVASSHLSMTPTVTSPAVLTSMGILIGTAAYMSPEQTRGGTTDRRSDVWAFGCVLYEMLAGRRAFVGEDISDTIAAVRKSEPAWSSLPPATPAAIRRLLRRCLAKDRRARLADIVSARLEIDDAQTLPPGFEGSVPSAPRSRWLAIGVTAAISAAAVSGVFWWATRVPSPVPVALTIGSRGPRLGGASLNNWDVAIAPDGQHLVFLAGEESTLQLFVRPLDRLEAQSLPAGKDLVAPFFSPDGRWVGFVDETAGPLNSVLKKTAVVGGQPVTITPILSAVRGASWGPDDTIVFATLDRKSGLFRVSAGGGQPEPLTTVLEADTDHYFPEVLPGGHAVLFTIASLDPARPNRIAVLDLASHEQTIIIENGSNARYVASGHIVFAAEGTLRAVGFDVDSLQVRGNPVPVLEGVVTKANGAADFAVSSNGTLVYRTGAVFGTGARTLAWVDRQGGEEPIPVPSRAYAMLSLSPDGAQVALEVRDQQNDIWIWNFARRTLTRSTIDPLPDGGVVWTPDGRRLAYSRIGDNGNIYWQEADGTGAPERLTQRERPQRPTSVSPDGRTLIFSEPADPPRDLVILNLPGERKAEFLIGQTPFDELNGEISPDHRWLAYESNESGRKEVYVRPFPNVSAGRWQVSTNGGTRPLWRRDSRELFYWSATGDTTGQIMAARVEPGGSFTSGPPRLVLPRSYLATTPGRSYDVSLDGQRFLVIKDAPAPTALPSEIVVVLNWTEELKRLVPAN